MMAARRPPALAGRGPLWESGAGLRRALPRRAGAALSGAGSLAVTDDALQEKKTHPFHSPFCSPGHACPGTGVTTEGV